METMFAECSSLGSLDLSNFDTQNVKSMYCMFCKCNYLYDLDISNFNIDKVTNMDGMFACCFSLEYSGVKTGNNLSYFPVTGLYKKK